MPIWLIAILSCLGVLLGLWIINVIIGVIFLFVNKKQIHHIETSLSIILAQKYDVSFVLAKFLVDSGIELSEKLQYELRLNKKLNFTSFETGERKKIANHINDIVTELLQVASKADVEDKKRLHTLINSLSDAEKQSRHEVISYNNKVWAYNYWINFLPFKPI